MSRSDSGVLSEQLTAARRKYDRKYEQLESIDDKAMRTARTAVLVLGFVASAAAVGGPNAVASANTVALGTGVVGVLFLVGAGFLSIGVYTETIIPEDATRQLTVPGTVANKQDWQVFSLRNIIRATDRLDEEIDGNRGFLQYANILLLAALLLLGTAAFSFVTVSGFGRSPGFAPLAVGGALVGGGAVTKLMFRD